MGLEVERFAARLWLTLHYVELQRDNSASQVFFSRLKDMTNLKSDQTNDDISIVFKVPQFNLMDLLVMTLLVIFLVETIFKGVL